MQYNKNIKIVKRKNLGDRTLHGSMVSLTDLDNKSLEVNMNIMTPDDEKVIQLNFKNQILLEIKKVGFFFNENLSFYKARTEKIKVIKF